MVVQSDTQVGTLEVSNVISPRLIQSGLTEVQHACLVNLDNSASMYGSGAIHEVARVIPKYIDDVRRDAAIRSSVLMTFGQFGENAALKISAPFSSVQELVSPKLTPHGCTPLCQRLVDSVELLIEARKFVRRIFHVDQRHAWLIEMTDGSPTDGNVYEAARKAVQEVALENGIEVYLFGVGSGADMGFLRSIEQPGRPAEPLSGDKDFARLFDWLKRSQMSVSRSLPGEVMEIPSISGALIKTQ